jgi:pimeloyl-ACP methyl ester carboxylesterase
MASTELRPASADRARGVVSESIAEVGYRRIGGIDQWVMVRGENIANPPLVLLHGGPGMSETALFRYYNAPLEQDFTVVYWDQRGAGKSFSRAIPRSSMTVEQFLSDLDQLIDSVCARVDQERVVLYGHSWGSVLGTLYAARHPEKVAAYVGSGQVGDGLAGEEASYAFALAEAERRGKRRLVEKLRAIGPPPHSGKQVFAQRTVLAQLDGTMRPKSMWRMYWPILAAPESSLRDLPDFMRGFRFSLDALWPEAFGLNLIDLVPELQMPAFFFLGRNDHWVPAEASVAYIEVLAAPSKRLVWFEHSGHEPFVDEPAKFNALMAELVRPALVDDGEAQVRHGRGLPEG